MNEIENLLSIEECNCGRPYCDFFGGSVGEYGSSFSREDIRHELRKLEGAEELIQKVRDHLESLLD